MLLPATNKLNSAATASARSRPRGTMSTRRRNSRRASKRSDINTTTAADIASSTKVSQPVVAKLWGNGGGRCAAHRLRFAASALHLHDLIHGQHVVVHVDHDPQRAKHHQTH